MQVGDDKSLSIENSVVMQLIILLVLLPLLLPRWPAMVQVRSGGVKTVSDHWYDDCDDIGDYICD